MKLEVKIISDATEIQRPIRDDYKELYVNKMDTEKNWTNS